MHRRRRVQERNEPVYKVSLCFFIFPRHSYYIRAREYYVLFLCNARLCPYNSGDRTRDSTTLPPLFARVYLRVPRVRGPSPPADAVFFFIFVYGDATPRTRHYVVTERNVRARTRLSVAVVRTRLYRTPTDRRPSINTVSVR